GIEAGYRYVDSPVVCYDPGPQPEPYGYAYEPMACPGARLPHLWVDGQTALHDLCGDGYTLLRLGGSTADTTALEKELRTLGAPWQVLDLDEPHLRATYGADLLLLRPDLHVAWRGDEPPTHPAEVAATVTGWAVRRRG
ncbi:MAG: hypothetical protein QOE40_2247, partial [Actinomycetota bacterium]|nr:hypothetical protein [Actinomycetota bacterium]